MNFFIEFVVVYALFCLRKNYCVRIILTICTGALCVKLAPGLNSINNRKFLDPDVQKYIRRIRKF